MCLYLLKEINKGFWYCELQMIVYKVNMLAQLGSYGDGRMKGVRVCLSMYHVAVRIEGKNGGDLLTCRMSSISEFLQLCDFHVRVFLNFESKLNVVYKLKSSV